MRERGERPENPVPPVDVAGPVRPPVPIDWMKLDGQEREEILLVLIDWVPKMIVSYALAEQVVPRCWFHHEAMVHELLALFQYRQQQQFNTALGPPPSAPIDFQYQLELWKGRMRSLVGDAGCTPTNHHKQTLWFWVDPARTESAEWALEAETFAHSLHSLD